MDRDTVCLKVKADIFDLYIYIKKILLHQIFSRPPGGRGLHVVTVAIMTESTLQGSVAS